MNTMLAGKNIVIMGVANHRSIAWGIAQSLSKAGANLIFTYQGERLRENVAKLTEELEQESLLINCDVTKDDEVEAAFAQIKEKVGVIHGLAHCIAFARTEELEGEFVNTSRDGYALAQDISAYSLVAVARAARPLMTEGGSIVTLTYLGGERVVPNYNVMGVAKAALDASVRYLAGDLGKENIRVNAISAGPIRTLAAKGIRNFNSVLKEIEERAPLRRTIDQSEVGDTALFLMSHLSRGITGEIIHVDAGYNIMGK
ncbi:MULTISPECIES: enoyl-ACP reductase FabI [Brevibacillus]|jgi:enoyl-[acyl-carrier protein] reductase I|uniref:Enoyl-[acyl-carrier-protein] reductase [NADH] n=1 Tax=Brevibacillus borstelensis AK1 TaxID=1300222 RepID=M8DEM8_9BACL|nr:enoyl-ACP reductase FabI [Brevibacillus borstelensis]EMT54804.1 enoyl-(acyl carrier protein) reductase [Brevibacillus borstelensis AK1]KKX52650.1 enoyl-ACP reductase [Brevibacillus borstelensis cifa_chp40]MBE5394322.1 enoyl-ACP reductase FabI [Brevibacillus borstelensis]MCC0565264.1 enoyl-ACP reductase FabI [Brevibacillus borstelensis]MCM3471934.1 enoyl-ACP reductase FabI [Brevibacillus borstelensis]